MMAGPGKMCAFVRCAQEAMRRGPRVYWDWTVPKGGKGLVSHRLMTWIEKDSWSLRTSNVPELAVLEDEELLPL